MLCSLHWCNKYCILEKKLFLLLQFGNVARQKIQVFAIVIKSYVKLESFVHSKISRPFFSCICNYISKDFGYILLHFKCTRLHSDYFLAIFWLHFGYISDTFWLYLATSRIHFGYILAIFCLHFEYVLVTFGYI